MIGSVPDTAANAMIGEAVQLAIAPIFLLVAAGAFLNVMTQRLGRVVDRARTLESLIDADGEQRDCGLRIRLGPRLRNGRRLFLRRTI